jgi:hypothetical protein
MGEVISVRVVLCRVGPDCLSINPYVNNPSLKATFFHFGVRIKKNKTRRIILRVLFERLAATYSRGSYTTTTIGKAAFDGRVRNGIGSDHSFMATKLLHTATADLPQ